MNNVIIGISGKLGSGKDTLAWILTELIQEHQKNFNRKVIIQHERFSAPLKKVVTELTGKLCDTQEEKLVWIEELGMTVGTLMQKIGQEMRDVVSDTVWVSGFKYRISKDSGSFQILTLVTDLRYRTEVVALEQLNAITIRLEGDPAKIRKNSDRDPNHLSETDLDNYDKWTFKYTNDQGLQELRDFASSVVVYLVKNQLIN